MNCPKSVKSFPSLPPPRPHKVFCARGTSPGVWLLHLEPFGGGEIGGGGEVVILDLHLVIALRYLPHSLQGYVAFFETLGQMNVGENLGTIPRKSTARGHRHSALSLLRLGANMLNRLHFCPKLPPTAT